MLGPFWGKEGKAGALDSDGSGLTGEKPSTFPPMGKVPRSEVSAYTRLQLG